MLLGIEIYKYDTREMEFGASSSCSLYVENKKVVAVTTERGETNYAWDGFPLGLPQIGQDKYSALKMMDEYFDSWADEYRQPNLTFTGCELKNMWSEELNKINKL